MVIAVPTGIKIFSWIATLYGGSLIFTTPLIFTIGFLALFTIGGLTGVILSNAALDLALHDSKIIFSHYPYLEILTFCPISVWNLKTPATLLASDRDAFLVGLIDGDGSIQVNHWRHKILQYRLVVKLGDNPLNFEMLYSISKFYGGKTTKVLDKKSAKSYVLWVVNDKKVFKNSIIPLLLKYPPLTTRIKLQFNFLLKCFNSQDLTMEEYFQSRTMKYENRAVITPNELDFVASLPCYFKSWLAGFIEAEGCFSNRKAGNFTFSIAQNYDYYLIYAIRNYYNLQHLKICHKRGKVSNIPLYEFSVGSINGIEKIINHCQFLLQGYKYYQLAVFVNNNKYLSAKNYRLLFWKE